MKIRISITIEADKAAYEAEYGETISNEDFRRDVVLSSLNAIAQTAYPESSLIIKTAKLNGRDAE